MPGGSCGEVLAQDVLAGATLRGAARQHGREPPNDLALLAVGGPPLLIAHAELLERAPGAIEPLPQLLGGQFALRRSVGEPPELGGLQRQLRSEIAVDLGGRTLPQGDRQTAEHAEHDRRQRHRPRLGRHAATSLCVSMPRP